MPPSFLPRRKFLYFACLAMLAFGQPKLVAAETVPDDRIHNLLLPEEQQNLAYRWVNICQELAAREVDRVGARPTIISRQMAIWATAMYDAWACYDEKALGTRLGDQLRRPAKERTLKNKSKALSYASYYALLDVFGSDQEFLDRAMQKLGCEPSVKSIDPKTPEGVGYLCAQAVIDYRHHDGANQLGDEAGGNGKPYSDYTFYRCANTADECVDPDCWQPITFTKADGSKICPTSLTPQWYRVKPFLLENSAQFRPPPPPSIKKNREVLQQEVDQVLYYNAHLTLEQKAIVEFMRDGPRSTAQSGHWLRFAQDVSKRDKNDLDKDVKLYFLVANTAMDAFISCWETKRVYDTSRPWTLVRYFYKGQKVLGWAGPEGGVKEMPAEEWHPYSPDVFITPPFPGYTSGHATVSAACSKMLEYFTGSDEFGFVAHRRCCELTEKNFGPELDIKLPTFSETADMAALSRAMGGYHIPNDNNVGLKVGRAIAEWSWPKYQAYFNGTARTALR